MRQQIVDVSLREGIPTPLTALHVAEPGLGFDGAAMPAGGTPAELLRRLGLVLLLLGALALGLARAWR